MIPDFRLASSGDQEFVLSNYKGKKIVLYFYPKDSTPGCTLEGQAFHRLLPEFAKLNTLVFGVSRDSVKSHCKFRDKYGFAFELLSDEDEKVCKLFDVIKEKNMYGRMVLGIERSTFIIDENQNLLKEYRKVKADGHAEEVLQYLKSL